MSRDFDNQYLGKDFLIDTGLLTLGSDGTVSCYTTLNTILAAVAMHRAPATGQVLFASSLYCSALSSGVVTITDSSGNNNAGATVTYILIGLQ